MAKTEFVDGSSTLSAAFVNSIYRTDGGHKHDGGSDDGSAGKIGLEDEIDWGTGGTATVDETADVYGVSGINTEVLLEKGTGFFSWAAEIIRAVTAVVTNKIAPASGDTVSFENLTGTTQYNVECEDVTAVNGTFSGDVGAVNGAFSANVVAGGTVFSDTVDASTVDADVLVSNRVEPQSGDTVSFEDSAGTTQYNIECEDITAVDGTFSGDVEAASITAPEVPVAVAGIGSGVAVIHSYGVSSVANPSTGTYTMTVPSDTFVVLVTPRSGSTSLIPTYSLSGTTLTVYFKTTGGTLTDTDFSVVCWGTGA